MLCVLGFDGGGTKTECVALGVTGEILARGRGSASNPSRIGVAPALRGVQESANTALRSIPTFPTTPRVAAVCAGLAGTGKEELRLEMARGLEAIFEGAVVRVQTDLELALAALPEGPGIVLVAGTGSAAIGRDAKGSVRREGGLGPSGSDEGSAFDIGRAVASAVRDEKTIVEMELSRQILRHLGCASWADVDARASAQPDEIFPRIFPVVTAAAEAGNKLAQSLLVAGAGKLAALTERLAQTLGLGSQSFFLGRTGGMLERSQVFDKALDAEIQRRLPRAVKAQASADAALVAARTALGLLQAGQGAAL
ncbi:MAG TPA: BadF/BadG/BcrA/BcrD ATPase family protein [Dongiaceae bacterium]|nr:BadF/BadG/BcrA/BcrD ATPase family protein [Dongiaceae bacterium]